MRRRHYEPIEMQLLHGNHLLVTRYSPKALGNCVVNDECYQRTQGPAELYQIEIFFCACNVFRQFVPSCGNIASPLNDELRKHQPFNLERNKNDLEAMGNFQEKLILPAVLTVTYAEGQILLNTDSCEAGCLRLK